MFDGTFIETASRHVFDFIGGARETNPPRGGARLDKTNPDSINFFHHVCLHHVSCSPYRLPVARVAAALDGH
jgi:hypothetical protein